MNFRPSNYVPTLAVRPSEMKGLEHLHEIVKDLITPCFLLAPWVNSKTLIRSIDKIEIAFPDRKYFLDIDINYESQRSNSAAQLEFENLKDPINGFKNWIDLISSRENIVPCVQYKNAKFIDIKNQVDQFRIINRPFCIRLTKSISEEMRKLINFLSSEGSADFVIILDAGWVNSPIEAESWFEGIISNYFDQLIANIPIVLSYTSIPDTFSDFNSKELSVREFSNRTVFENLRRKTNRIGLIYGDWASTRPRNKKTIASRPIDRIDYPTINSWVIARNKEDGWSFYEAADLIVKSKSWDPNLKIWGTSMIENTLINPALGIDTPQKNIAVRVNIHLHQQAVYRGELNLIPIEEEWRD